MTRTTSSSPRFPGQIRGGSRTTPGSCGKPERNPRWFGSRTAVRGAVARRGRPARAPSAGAPPRALRALRGQGSEGNEPGPRRHRTLAPPILRERGAIRAPFATPAPGRQGGVPGDPRISRLRSTTPPTPSANRHNGHPIRNESPQTPSPHCPGRAERQALAESGRARRSGAWAERAPAAPLGPVPSALLERHVAAAAARPAAAVPSDRRPVG